MNSYSNNEKREIIMKHYLEPKNKIEKISDNIKQIYLHSSSCVDELYLHLDIENEIITNTYFSGVGCAIFTAATDIFLSSIKNKNIEQAKNLQLSYLNMLNNQSFDNSLGELIIFQNVKNNFNRYECAKLIIDGFDIFINEK